LLQAPPPQSTPVSAPFFLVSLQVAAAQAPLVQTQLMQSPSTKQGIEVPQR
jgi:hypothetical protein